MKICILASANSEHTKKIVKFLQRESHDVVVISLTHGVIENTKVYNLGFQNIDVNDGKISKVKYLRKLLKIKKIIKLEEPDIVHAHYASSYGFLGMLAGFKPFFISAWGSDIFIFPKKSIIHRKILEYSLKAATKVFSTSEVMALEMGRYTDKDVVVTPFGIDLDKYNPNKKKNHKGFNIGLAKSLEQVYGIDILIRAVSNVINNNGFKEVKLMLAGQGSKREEFYNLAVELGIKENVEFLGCLNEDKIIEFYSELDLVVVPSRSESFGVVAVEAQAFEIPLIVSNAPGLQEVTLKNETALVFEIDNVNELTDKINLLIKDTKGREQMGRKGRELVCEKYEYKSNLNKMIEEYLKYKK